MTGRCALTLRGGSHRNRTEAGHRDELPLVVLLPVVVCLQRCIFVLGCHPDYSRARRRLLLSTEACRLLPEPCAAGNTLLTESTESLLATALLATAALQSPALDAPGSALSEPTGRPKARLLSDATGRGDALRLAAAGERPCLERALGSGRTGLLSGTPTAAAAESLAAKSTQTARTGLGATETTLQALPPCPATTLRALAGTTALSPALLLGRTSLTEPGLSEHLRCPALKQRRVTDALLVEGRTVDASIGVDRQKAERVPGDRIRVLAPEETEAVCFHQGVDTRGIDAEAPLVFLDCAHILLAAEYQLFFLFTLRLHLICRHGCRHQDGQGHHEDHQGGEGEPAVVRHCTMSGSRWRRPNSRSSTSTKVSVTWLTR